MMRGKIASLQDGEVRHACSTLRYHYLKVLRVQLGVGHAIVNVDHRVGYVNTDNCVMRTRPPHLPPALHEPRVRSGTQLNVANT